jgi:hypothetical protein
VLLKASRYSLAQEREILLHRQPSYMADNKGIEGYPQALT